MHSFMNFVILHVISSNLATMSAITVKLSVHLPSNNVYMFLFNALAQT